MQINDRYLVKLTWLRGIAATLVVASHSIRLAEGNYKDGAADTSKSLFWYFDLGSFGVILFFALSGATLYFSNKNIKGFNGHLRFYTKRFMRIWPTFAISMIVYVLFIPIFREYYIAPQGNWVEHQFLTHWTWLDFSGYFSLTANILAQTELFNSAFWSLPVEFQYYLIFPLIILSMRHSRYMGPVAIAVLLFAVQKYRWIELFDQRVFALAYTFCFGMLLAYGYERTSFRINKPLAIVIFVTAMSIASLAQNGIIDFGDIPFISNSYGWNGISGVVCVACVLFYDKDMNKDNWLTKPVYYLGEISFSLYLYHNLVISTLLLLVLQFEAYVLLRSPLFIFVLTMPITLPLAIFSYHYVEKNSIKLGRYLTKKKSRETEYSLQSDKIE